MIGKTISHYKIIEKLGEGGMGVVYKAEDTKLERTVALKFLRQDLSRDDESKERFIHEAQAASALDHPNICTIYEIDETKPVPGEPGDGQMFIAMACYEGESLKDRIERGPLRLDEAVNIAIQIAQGLARAHEEDIVHRDIKPANVMITNRGEVKIVDFGLAKLSGRTKLTKEGTTLGTVAYMSPEQAHGAEVDHRTDLWALGAVLHEMISGQQPFEGEYEQAVMYAIMNEDPEPITGLRTGVSMELERIVNKCLAKEPAERYQHADELLVDLRRLQKASKSEVLPSKKVFRKELSKKRFYSFIVPGMLFILAVFAIAGYFSLSREAQNTERIPIAVVDFVNETDEKELNGLSGMLITALEQSRRLSVLTRSRMFDLLKQLGKENVDRIDEALGREICQKANVHAMVIASIRKFGQVYAIDLKVLDPEKDEYLFTAREEGKGQESVLSMLDKLSKKTREGLKEKTAEIQAASQKVAEVTTTNLQAYRHFFQGEQLISQLKYKEAKEEFKKAISLDSTFALAYFRLSYAMSYWAEEGAEEPLKKAVKYIYNAPEKEQHLILALKAELDRDFDEAIAQYQTILKLYPEEKEALFQIGDRSFHRANFNVAKTYLEKVLTLDPTFEDAYWHIIWTYQLTEQYDKMLQYAKQYVANSPGEMAYSLLGEAYRLQGDFDSALHAYHRALELFPNSITLILDIGNAYLFKNDYEKAEVQFNQLLKEPYNYSQKIDGYRALSKLYAYYGKFRDILRMIDKIIEINIVLGDSTDLARSYAEKAYWLVVGRNNQENAKMAIEKGLKLKHMADLNFYFPLFKTYLMMGEFVKASFIAKNQLSAINPFCDLAVSAYSRKASGEYEEAIKEFQAFTMRWFPWDFLESLYDLAQCYVQAGQLDLAIKALQRLQGIYSDFYFSNRAVEYPKSFYLLGKIYESEGEKNLAIENYEKFLEIWRDADEDLLELIDAKARLPKLKAITGKRSAKLFPTTKSSKSSVKAAWGWSTHIFSFL